MSREDFAQVVARHGLGEVVALHFGTPELRHCLCFGFVFDPFGDDPHAQYLAEGYDRLDDRLEAVRPVEPLDERAVNFDLVEAEMAQMSDINTSETQLAA